MTERAIHRAILQYLHVALPRGSIVHHSANEIDMRGPEAARAISKAKSLGMVKGWPDLQVCLPGGRTVFLEVKSGRGKATESQVAVIDRLHRLGFHAAVVRSVDDVVAALLEAGAWDDPASQPVTVRGVVR